MVNFFHSIKYIRRPSGNPEEDTNAHIYELEKSYRDTLVSESSKLYRLLRAKETELRAVNQSELRSLESLEAMAKTFDKI